MIHYHGTPFSGDTPTQLAIKAKHCMVSFEAPSEIQLVAEMCQSFCLDNGAFSAWKRGSEYKPDQYVKWAKMWLRHPGCDFAVAPDSIDGTEKDNKDLLRMVPHDAKWVPVWHLHESLERLRHLSYTWPRVALGSSGEYSDPGSLSWWGRIAEAMEVITDGDGFPNCRLHGLRMLDPVIFSHLPLASADSTNVARNIGIDKRWTGPYVPSSPYARAMVIMDRIESHAAASRWNPDSSGVQQNFMLLG